MADAYTDAVMNLQQAREEAAQAVAVAQQKLDQIDQALGQLQNTVMISDPPRRKDFYNLGIVEATKRFLSEAGEAETPDIAKEILARGVLTRSKNFVPTVYATLANSELFVRKGKLWTLKTARGTK